MRMKIERKIASTDNPSVSSEKGNGSNRRGLGSARLKTIQPATDNTVTQTNFIEPQKLVMPSATLWAIVALLSSAASSANTWSTLRRVSSSAEPGPDPLPESCGG